MMSCSNLYPPLLILHVLSFSLSTRQTLLDVVFGNPTAEGTAIASNAAADTVCSGDSF